jgi:hypothetical protein
LLRRGGRNVLVIKLGTDLHEALTLLDRVSWLFPDTATIVIGDTENPALRRLAWDLGAAAVLFPPQQRYHLVDLVSRFLEPELLAERIIVEDANLTDRSPAEES